MNLDDLYKDYLAECDAIAEQCVAEGYPSHGSNYELRVEQLKEYYPELFDENTSVYVIKEEEELTEFVGYTEDGIPMFETVKRIPEAN